MSLRNEYDALNKKVLERFEELRKENITIIFLDEDDIKEGCFCDYFDVIDVNSGEVYEVSVVELNSEGITVVESRNTSNIKVIGFQDLHSLLDKISFVELIEAKLKF